MQSYLPATRRGIAGLQMGFTFVMLLPILTPPGTTIVAVLFAIPLLGGFLKDWLIVCGMLKPARLTVAKTARFATTWLPVFLRLALVILMVGQLLLRFLDGPVQLTSSQATAIANVGLLLLSATEFMVILMILLGAAGRIAAMMALLLAGFEYLVFRLTPQLIMIAITATAFLYLGTGGYSLWKPDRERHRQRCQVYA